VEEGDLETTTSCHLCWNLAKIHMKIILTIIELVVEVVVRDAMVLSTIRSSLKSVKDRINLMDMKGVYIIPCSCGTSYIGETGCSINQRMKEHVADIKHRRTKSSALAEHAEKTKHHICIEEAKVIAKFSHFHH